MPRLPPNDYITSLDIGQLKDHCAFVVLERAWFEAVPSRRILPDLTVRYLQRWELGTGYPEVIEQVCRLVGSHPLVNPILAVDFTGVGTGVMDFLRRAKPRARLVPIIITAGHNSVRNSYGGWNVPKEELVSSLQVLLQTRRIKVKKIPGRDVLLRELENFRVRITSHNHETYEGAKEEHDDVAMSLMQASWIAQRPIPATPTAGGAPVILWAPEHKEDM